MSKQFLFVPTLGADSTNKLQELQRADVKRHAALASHRGKSKSQIKSPQSSASRRGHVLPQTDASKSSLIPPKVLRVHWLSGSQCLVTGPDAPTRLKCDNERCLGPRDSPGTDTEESGGMDKLDIANLLLKYGTRRDIPASIISDTGSKMTLPVIKEHSPSFSRAMEYFTQVLIPNNSPVYAIFDVSNVNCLYFLEMVQSYKAHYVEHAVLALLHLVVGNVVPQTNSAQNALYHTGAAISLLRKMISEQGDWNDDATIVSVICLASFARSSGDYVAYNVHRNRLALMLESRGGLDNTGFQGIIKALALQFAPPLCIPLSMCFQPPADRATVGALDPSDPFFHDTRRLMPEMAPNAHLDAELRASIKKLPHGFQSLVYEAGLSLKTIQLLCRIVDARREQSKAQQYGPQQGASVPSTGEKWHVARYSDFWECCPAISRAGPDLEKYLCLALLLYTANEFAPERACNKGMALYGEPRALLAAEVGLLNHVQLTPRQRECWIWIWWVVIDSSSEVDKVTKKARSLMDQFWAMFPEVHRWKGLRRVLQRFFWGGRFEDMVRQLVNAQPPPPPPPPPPTSAAPPPASAVCTTSADSAV